MAFSPDLDDPVSRVRFAVGDTSEPAILAGGEATYEALLLTAGADLSILMPAQLAPEAAATKAAAAALAAWAGTQPDRLTSADGESLSWSGRIAQWNKIALGTAGATTPGDPGSATSDAAGSDSVATIACW